MLRTSNKVILISEKENLSSVLPDMLNKHGLDRAREYSNLSSLEEIRKNLARTGNTSFIRTELLRFIRELGFPFLFILDYRVNTGMDKKNDPDGMKLLRTFLISCIILARGSGFEGIRGNFLLLIDKEELKKARQLETEPQHILHMLSTSDKNVNAFIEELKSDTTRFNQLFFMRTLDAAGPVETTRLLVDTLVKAIRSRDQIGKKKDRKAVIDSGEYEAAGLLYRFDDEKVYMDGEIRKVEKGSMNRLEKGEFYITGRWVNKNLVTTADKILRAIRKGLGGEKTFSGNEEIVINLTGKCVVDSTLTPSLIQMLTNDLGDFPNIIININDSNNDILSQAKGYSLLRKNLRLVK